VLLVTLCVLLIYSGVFDRLEDISTGKPPIGKTIIAYKFEKGPYNESGQIFTEAAIISPKNKALGIYYDDPQKVESKNLRYAVGSILCEGDGKIDEDEVKSFTEGGFKILHLPEVTYAVKTKFPHATPLSILFGTWKAYPKLRYYIEEHKLCAYPFLEYYEGDFIHYIAPLSKQDQFVVPECEEDKCSEDITAYDETTLNTSRSSYGENTENEDNITKNLTDDSFFKMTHNSSSNDGKEEDLEKEKGSSVTVPEVFRDNSRLRAGTEDSEPATETAEDEASMSDGSTSSFEVIKSN